MVTRALRKAHSINMRIIGGGVEWNEIKILNANFADRNRIIFGFISLHNLRKFHYQCHCVMLQHLVNPDGML